PGRGAGVPARRLECLTGGLPVLRQERRALVEPLGVVIVDRARDRGVDRGAALGELRAVGDLLRQWVLEGEGRVRVRRLLVEELRRDERVQGSDEIGRG